MNLDELGVRIEVDSFLHPRVPRFITHYHRDHVTGIERPAPGKTYCSEETRKLLVAVEGFHEDDVCAVKPFEPVELDGGLKVTALPANHCVGSLMFVFERRGRKLVWTGDFRYTGELAGRADALRGADWLYTDSTFADPQFVFPPQEEAIEEVLKLVRRDPERETIIASYTVGKDKVLRAIFEEFKRPFYMLSHKRRVYRALGWEEMYTDDKSGTNFRTYPRNYVQTRSRARVRKMPDCVAILPTGWAAAEGSAERFHYVPYSEHCDHREYRRFLEDVRAKKVIEV